MTRILLTAIGALALIVATSYANAADSFARQQSVKETPVSVELVGNPFAGPYGGLTAGGQYTDITITGGSGEDGFLIGAHTGWNFCRGRVCLAPQIEYAVTDVSVNFGPLGEVVRLEDYFQLVAVLGAQVGNSSFVSIHGGYEWQNWTVGNAMLGGETDVDVGAWVIGIGIDTLVAPQLSVGLALDYLFFDSIEADGLNGRENDSLTAALEDSDALRVKLKTTWRPAVTSNLVNLDNFRF